jgi:hypothetical protein
LGGLLLPLEDGFDLPFGFNEGEVAGNDVKAAGWVVSLSVERLDVCLSDISRAVVGQCLQDYACRFKSRDSPAHHAEVWGCAETFGPRRPNSFQQLWHTGKVLSLRAVLEQARDSAQALFRKSDRYPDIVFDLDDP